MSVIATDIRSRLFATAHHTLPFDKVHFVCFFSGGICIGLGLGLGSGFGIRGC
jgi:hypothetical protein